MFNFNIFEKFNINFNGKGGSSLIIILKLTFRLMIVAGIILFVKGLGEGWENSLSFWSGFSVGLVGLFFNWLIH